MRNRTEFNQAFPVQVELPVQWGDMDAFGHVNNTMYFRYFETARLAYFNRLGMMENQQQSQIGPILASTDCQFKRALKYPDDIITGASVTENHEYGFMMRYGIYSKTQDTVTSLGSGRVVMVDYANGQKVRPTAALLEGIRAVQAALD